MPIPTNQPGQNRCVIERVTPELDAGRYAIKATVGDVISVEADVFADGHDKISARLLYRPESAADWLEVPMNPIENDRYGASFLIEKEGFYRYTFVAWVDHPLTWQHEITLKIRDGQRVEVELLSGALFFDEMATLALPDDARALQAAAKLFRDKRGYEHALHLATGPDVKAWIARYPLRHHATRYDRELAVYVDRERARFGAWYSLFPRSTHPEPGQHGTFRTTAALLPRLADMGFDVLYIPPIHHIGTAFRKGKNNAVTAQPGEPGVPYGIGSELGGHDAIHPDLGTLEEFKALVEESQTFGIEVALDLAIQCSPDHPWVRDHPDWFRLRPDGTIQYAENPPKKYQDIYPLNFETDDWRNLWEELKRVLLLWGAWGVRIIRVDNPHTKAFGFWEWVIAEVKAEYPDMLFLSEAFTRPKVMQQLAKLGFSQSYTYFAWRETKAGLTQYLTELTQGEMRHYFRPNFWPNTHDILTWPMQSGSEALYLSRFFMAATLSSNYGIYGPVYEYLEHTGIPGKEEYFNSEKYEIRHWNWQHVNKLTYVIGLVNKARRENSALQHTNNITFCDIANDHLLAYLKTHADGNRILCVVNLDPAQTQAGQVRVPFDKIGKGPDEEYLVRDLLTDAAYVWRGETNFIALDPHVLPMHLFRVEDLYR
ncbi:MAG: alpha-1,4-glucan--maltose-1-phosphate maltosyltransferase [Cytophagaceae bacterium]|nr:alpha-1,4-glucan--maltose-1-phosphate maltosyltransferase [Cytophagaceae bacterium]